MYWVNEKKIETLAVPRLAIFFCRFVSHRNILYYFMCDFFCICLFPVSLFSVFFVHFIHLILFTSIDTFYVFPKRNSNLPIEMPIAISRVTKMEWKTVATTQIVHKFFTECFLFWSFWKSLFKYPMRFKPAKQPINVYVYNAILKIPFFLCLPILFSVPLALWTNWISVCRVYIWLWNARTLELWTSFIGLRAA